MGCIQHARAHRSGGFVNRYQQFEGHSDCGLGADESQMRRFTRPVERVERSRVAVTAPQLASPDHSDDEDRLDIRIRVGMLTRAADLLHEVLLETPMADQYRGRLRDLALATKDVADDVARSHDLRADRPGQEDAPGPAATGSEGDVPTPTKEEN